jgi:GTP-binding protein
LHLIDVYNKDIAAAYQTIMKELAAYKVDLSKRPQIIALTKIEGLDKKALDKIYAQLKAVVPRGVSTAAISSSSGEGVKALLRVVQSQVEKTHKAEDRVKKTALPVIGIKPDDDAWQVEKTDSGFLITGRKIERFAGRTRFGNEPAEQRLRDILKKMGIMRELERQKIEAGQKITIGQPEIGRLKY